MSTQSGASTTSPGGFLRKFMFSDWPWGFLLLVILAGAAYFRFTGILWGEFQYLHPDERFLVWVTADLIPVRGLSEYFNTAVSTLNPHNVGHGFFVYGTYPILLARYLVEWIFGGGGWEPTLMVGRILSASFDLMTVFFVYLIGLRLFNRVVGLLGAAFSAVAVMQIQQAHFYTSDSFATTLSTMALFFAVSLVVLEEKPVLQPSAYMRLGWLRSNTVKFSLLFGVSVGLAMACKVNTAPTALLLPAVWMIRILRKPLHERAATLPHALLSLSLAGVMAVLFFRIFQPYAFQGPSFFDVVPNQQWLQNLRSLAAQIGGDVDIPPALQWARRPVTFSLQNMVQWGMGLPMGILAWGGFLWMGWKIFKGKIHSSLLLWGWTGAYFIWQSLVHNPTMRYQLPIYPTLALIAGWTIYSLWEGGTLPERPHRMISAGFARKAAIGLGIAAIMATTAWAFAFTRIYTQPVTRVEASHWIYQRVPGPVNLSIESDSGLFTQPLPYEPEMIIGEGEHLRLGFKPDFNGRLTRIYFENLSVHNLEGVQKTLVVSVSVMNGSAQPVGAGTMTDNLEGSQIKTREILLDHPIAVERDHTYQINLAIRNEKGSLSVSGQAGVWIETQKGEIRQTIATVIGTVRADRPQEIRFTAKYTGILEKIRLDRVVDLWSTPGEKVVQASVYENSGQGLELGKGTVRSSFIRTEKNDPRGLELIIPLEQPVFLTAGENYLLQLKLVNGEAALGVYGRAVANESTWDDGLPLRLEGFDPFSGIYPRDLTFEMYWTENESKRERIVSILERADYIFISSNRQWGTTTRLPERYPLATTYYRNLLGCPATMNILWCYRVAEPGMFQGNLGFDLIKVFHSYPRLGEVTFNTQFAEEAFTVFDHPKVFIFQKRADYDQVKVEEILNAVDLTNVTQITPGQAPSYPADLMLPSDRLAQQQAGGTWSQLFDTQSLLNRFPLLGMMVWYLVITLLGWAVYPLIRVALYGLPDHGFPLVKISGLLLLSWVVWLAGSYQIPFDRWTILAAFLLLVLINIGLALWQRQGLIAEYRERRHYFLTVEGISLGLFLLFILIRFGNPDLWHPAFGGEKPMDFAYLNAVLKSTNFPPYNPWFSGGYINYYYYGFVLSAVPVKLLGIVPSIAYNLILPIMAAMLGLGAFSAGYNLIKGLILTSGESQIHPRWLPNGGQPYFGGILAIFAVLIMGNLGTVRMIWHGVMRLVAPGGTIDGSNWIDRLSWTVQGFSRVLAGERLPFSVGDWYWIPSRALPGEAITEFPFFTFLYGDPHAHLFALPLTLLAMGWCLAIVFGKWCWQIDQLQNRTIGFFLTVCVGGLAIGVLRPTNTWDMPTYFGLGLAAVGYGVFRYMPLGQGILKYFPAWLQRSLVTIGTGLLLVGLSFLFFQPYADWYVQGYTSVDFWEGARSPLISYLTHWGIFLFFIISWMIWETIDWMAKTPLSGLYKLRRFQSWIYFGLACYLVAIIYLVVAANVEIGWLTLTLAIWSLILILRPGQPTAKRTVLFFIGSAVTLTLAVDLVVLVGDIGRMNTVFKFYLQAWNLFAVSAAVSAVWLVPNVLISWRTNWAKTWRVFAILLVMSGLLYPVLAGSAKIRDRMSPIAPMGLDGMTFMRTSEYHDQGQAMDLEQDYLAIRWLQENITGSPVIVEGHTPEYRWGSRISIYTGLPAVIGWNWHQRQQRAGLSHTPVTTRVEEVAHFYNTTDKSEAREFLVKYGVKYIIVGQLERIFYEPNGIAKFPILNNVLWVEVYRDRETVIYEVKP